MRAFSDTGTCVDECRHPAPGAMYDPDAPVGSIGAGRRDAQGENPAWAEFCTAGELHFSIIRCLALTAPHGCSGDFIRGWLMATMFIDHESARPTVAELARELCTLEREQHWVRCDQVTNLFFITDVGRGMLR